ncbi:unnamed protein product [Sphagnum jensenii]
MYFLLVKEDSFTRWIEKALLPCTWQSNRSANVPFGAPWPSSPWNPWYPPWYPPMAPTTPMAPSARKGLLYPIYLIRTNSNVHV